MTAPKYMLDTNILSDLIKNPRGLAAQRVRQHQDELCTSIIVASELRYGCAKKGSAQLLRKVEDLLGELAVLAFDVPVDSDYGRIRNHLEAGGQPIGANDLFIAAHAYCLKLTLVTANIREFSRVQGLTVENWLVSQS